MSIYTPSGNPGTNAQGLSKQMRDEFTSIQAALDAYYSTGSWSPTDISGGGLTFSVTGCKYAKNGTAVLLMATIAWPATADTHGATIGGFPISILSGAFGGMAVGYTDLSESPMLQVGGSGIAVWRPSTGLQYTNAQLSGKTLQFTGSYISA